ncbi:MAG: putative Ammonia monooxygenase subunit X [Nitrosopumilales archaeon]|nr:MAG: putative Ammonia monooxygenase subunit X [Nitrosopumilales archaeon]
MTLPKGFGSGGGGGAGSADVERMIGRRVENMTGLITVAYVAAWLATFGGTAAGYFIYPWAYPTNSGHYAFIVLTIIESIGYIFCVKVSQEGSRKSSNGLMTVVIASVFVLTLYISIFVGF